MDETALWKKLAIFLFMFEVIGFMLSAVSLSNSALPTMTTLENYGGTVHNQTNNLATAWNYSPIQTLYTNPNDYSLGNVGAEFVNIFADIFILGYKIINFGVNLLIFIGTGLIIILFVIIIFIPSIFNLIQLGPFSLLFEAGYYLLTIALGFYAFSMVLNIFLNRQGRQSSGGHR